MSIRIYNPCPKSPIECRKHRDEDEYIKDRLEYKINLYTCKANRQKAIYRVAATVSMIAAAAVPVLINIDDKVVKYVNILATILSLLVTILVGFLAIYRPREHWRNYDLIAADLRKEEMLFSTSVGDYNIEDKTQKFRLLVNRVENLISQEREETIIMRTNEPDSQTKTQAPE